MFDSFILKPYHLKLIDEFTQDELIEQYTSVVYRAAEILDYPDECYQNGNLVPLHYDMAQRVVQEVFKAKQIGITADSKPAVYYKDYPDTDWYTA